MHVVHTVCSPVADLSHAKLGISALIEQTTMAQQPGLIEYAVPEGFPAMSRPCQQETRFKHSDIKLRLMEEKDLSAIVSVTGCPRSTVVVFGWERRRRSSLCSITNAVQPEGRDIIGIDT